MNMHWGGTSLGAVGSTGRWVVDWGVVDVTVVRGGMGGMVVVRGGMWGMMVVGRAGRGVMDVAVVFFDN